MIQKLQHRFILITMACIGFIFVLILLALNLFMTISNYRQGYSMLEEFAERQASEEFFRPAEQPLSREEVPTPEKNAELYPTEKEPSKDFSGRNNFHPGLQRIQWFNDMRIFSVFYDKTGNLLNISTGGNPNLTEDDLKSIATRILEKPKEKGRISGYLYLYKQTEEQTAIYFLDYTPENSMSTRLIQVCFWIGLGGMLVIFILVVFLSRWVTGPVRSAFDKQKQFIADASHELKTPLTIITANAEVLQGSMPDNKWLGYILDQSNRMKHLINNLLDLAKLDAYSEQQDFALMDLSKTVRNTALSFESLAYEYGKKYTMEIADDLVMLGNEGQIKQLITILLDNAFKYSDEQGHITVSLSHHGEKKQLLVHNTGKGIAAKDQKRIFERFYRSDSSRSRQFGGYGLGLSIAQSIVKAHKGHISVKSDGNTYTEFTILLP
ncbi:MAG: GHKL domain-containing protein [Lachnospiraceae bacterium]|nr:GHKL domain-containing protein [Lachnospiraceae bacterium]